MKRSATLSTCSKYRYSLSRIWGSNTEGFPVFIGMNPSACVDDAIVRKLIGFSTRWGYSGFRAVNLFSYRATDVKELARVVDPVGIENNDYFTKFSLDQDASIIVPCWGSRSKLPKELHYRIDEVNEILRTKPNVMCLGKTSSGDPVHPLMLGYDTPLVPYFE